MEMNVEETGVMRMLKTPIPSKEYDRSKTAGEYGLFKIFGQHDNI
jgi:hypothetical protein